MDRPEGQITLKSPCEVPYTPVTLLTSRDINTTLYSHVQIWGKSEILKAF